MRQAWDAYYENAQAIIYVVDAAEADSQSMLVSRMEFYNILYHDDLKEAVVLVLANKSDLPGARDAGEVSELFGLSDVRTHEWHVQGCCAITGQGLDEAIDWLTTKLNLKHETGAGSTTKNVTKLPDHDMRPKLTDLSVDGGGTMRISDLEAGGALKKAEERKE